MLCISSNVHVVKGIKVDSEKKTILQGSSDNPDSPDYLEENQEKTESNTSANNIIEVDLLGLLFIFFYLAILLLQFVGMIIHRWGTFQHLVSVTKLKSPLPMVIIWISIIYLKHYLLSKHFSFVIANLIILYLR
jgi:hypothetical protein